jgi:hypothetical protein
MCCALYMFVIGHVGFHGGCMWVSQVAYFVGYSLVGLCLWFRYPVSGVGVDCVDAAAMNKCMR